MRPSVLPMSISASAPNMACLPRPSTLATVFSAKVMPLEAVMLDIGSPAKKEALTGTLL